MKIISALLVAQILLTSFLVVKLVELDSRIVDYEAAADRLPTGAMDRVESQLDHVPIVPSGLSEERLREILASELSKHLDSLQNSQSPSFHGGPAAIDEATAVSPDQLQAQLEKVKQVIEYHTSVGRISMADMNALQLEISKLDDAGRKQMMRELVQRMNDGRLDGRF